MPSCFTPGIPTIFKLCFLYSTLFHVNIMSFMSHVIWQMLIHTQPSREAEKSLPLTSFYGKERFVEGKEGELVSACKSSKVPSLPSASRVPGTLFWAASSETRTTLCWHLPFHPQHLFVPTRAAWAGERQGTSGSRGLPQLRLLLPSGTSDTPEQRAGSSCHQPGHQRRSRQHPARHKPRGLRSPRRAPCCSAACPGNACLLTGTCVATAASRGGVRKAAAEALSSSVRAVQ